MFSLVLSTGNIESYMKAQCKYQIHGISKSTRNREPYAQVTEVLNSSSCGCKGHGLGVNASSTLNKLLASA
jgi:hypothetical protein